MKIVTCVYHLFQTYQAYETLNDIRTNGGVIMNEIQKRLQEFARNQALQYLNTHFKSKDYIGKLSFILVGSAATGLCSSESDVDIAIVCEKEIYDKISNGTGWMEGKPSEEIIDGIQLHYYAIPFDLIEEKFDALDDLYLYVYSNCVILQDADDQFLRRIKTKNSKSPEVRKMRLEGKLDMLLRRSRALELCIKSKEDILVAAEICFEIIKLSLKVAALLDNIDFEPRKRLFYTALSGETGEKVKDKIGGLFYTIGLAGTTKDYIEFPQELTDLIYELSTEAHNQGFNAGLERPDKRHAES